VTFVLIHFSKRFADKEIFDFFERERSQAGEAGLAGAYENIVLWLGNDKAEDMTQKKNSNS
jgi:hypothetical protein